VAAAEKIPLPDPGAVLHLVTKALELAKLHLDPGDSIIALLGLAKTLLADRVVASAGPARRRP